MNNKQNNHHHFEEPILETQQFLQFCEQMDEELETALPKLKIYELDQQPMQVRMGRLINSLTIQAKVRMLAYKLYQKQELEINKSKIIEHKKSLSFRSNHVEDQPIDKNIITALEGAFQKLSKQEQLQSQQIKSLAFINQQLQRQTKLLQTNYRALQLQCKQEASNILLQLNDYFNQPTNQREIQQLHSKLTTMQANIDALQKQISTLKRQLAMRAVNQEYLRSQHANAEKEVNGLKKQLKECSSKLKSVQEQVNVSEKRLQVYRQEEELKKEEYLIAFFNKYMFTLERSVKTKEEVAAHFQYLNRSLLISSEILLNDFSVRSFLTQSIENLTKKTIAKTQLLFRFTEFHKGFGSYLENNRNPLLLLFKLANNRICGGYCSGLKQEEPCFLFTYLGNGKVFGKNPRFKGAGCEYNSNILTFGNSELIIMNNANKEFKLNVSIFGEKYFELARMSDFVQGENNVIKFEKMEIHSIFF